VLGEGDRVPAAGVLVHASNVTADESLLTGESVPVQKIADQLAATELAHARPGGDGQPFVYSGSLITSGQGIASVVATGARVACWIARIGRTRAHIRHARCCGPRAHLDEP
jgi:P-type Ca2+ transporter type 2C